MACAASSAALLPRTVAAACSIAGNAPDEEALRWQQRVRNHPLYPRFHLAPPYGWMNDPHPVFFKGAYHLFYQFSWLADQPYDGPHSWGHAVSRDLVHWKHLPVALTPEHHGSDPRNHIWSGCVVDDGGVGTAIYTIDNIDVWVATSADEDLACFTTSPRNPVIKGPPGPGWAKEMRDPCVWREGPLWYLIAGCGLEGAAAVPLYSSPDLRNWTYLHPLFVGDPQRDGKFTECPAFFRLGDKHVLSFSRQARFHIGSYAGQRFDAQQSGRLDYGRVYVPQVLTDAAGRVVMFGWVFETPPRGKGLFSLSDEHIGSGFAGAQTLPRVLSLVDGALHIEPAPEIDRLRDEHSRVGPLVLRRGARAGMAIGGSQFEIRAQVRMAPNAVAGARLHDGALELRAGFDAGTGQVFIQTSAARLSAPLVLDQSALLDLRLYFDHSIVELYVNGTVCITERLYPRDPRRMACELFAEVSDVHVESCDVWTMQSIVQRLDQYASSSRRAPDF